MRGVVVVLIDAGYKERAGISKCHPFVVIAFAVKSSSSANSRTASGIKLCIGTRSDEVALVLLTIESSVDALSVVLRNALQVNRTANDQINVVSILHKHEVATLGEHLSYNRDVTVKSCSSDLDKPVF